MSPPLSQTAPRSLSLDRFARARLAHLPTPLEPMGNLTKVLGGPTLWVKRDDCTGLAMGGNKARQLEFYFGDALRLGADTVIITGAVQSNFVRQTAAAAAKLGLACDVQLEHRVATEAPEYASSGNVLLDRLLGARIHYLDEGADEEAADAALEKIADGVRARGGRPYVIHLAPGHPPLGALGYVAAMEELLAQAAERGVAFDAIVLPSGSAATHAGTLVGLRRRGDAAQVVGICVRRGKDLQGPRVLRQARAAAELIGSPGLIGDADVEVLDDWLGPGYGLPTAEMREAVALAARREGLLLDPVYTGKSMAGLIGLVRRGRFGAGANVLYLHTGGTPAIFGYASVLEGL